MSLDPAFPCNLFEVASFPVSSSLGEGPSSSSSYLTQPCPHPYLGRSYKPFGQLSLDVPPPFPHASSSMLTKAIAVDQIGPGIGVPDRRSTKVPSLIRRSPEIIFGKVDFPDEDSISPSVSPPPILPSSPARKLGPSFLSSSEYQLFPEERESGFKIDLKGISSKVVDKPAGGTKRKGNDLPPSEQLEKHFRSLRVITRHAGGVSSPASPSPTDFFSSSPTGKGSRSESPFSPSPSEVDNAFTPIVPSAPDNTEGVLVEKELPIRYLRIDTGE